MLLCTVEKKTLRLLTEIDKPNGKLVMFVFVHLCEREIADECCKFMGCLFWPPSERETGAEQLNTEDEVTIQFCL